MALGTTVILRQGNATRELPLEELYVAYQKTALQPGEFVAKIRIAQRAPATLLRAYKTSKRYDQDISAVFACFALTLDGTRIASARIGCGGVAATPKRATATEAALVGRTWDEATADAAARVLADEFAPIGDMRARRVPARGAVESLSPLPVGDRRPRVLTRIEQVRMRPRGEAEQGRRSPERAGRSPGAKRPSASDGGGRRADLAIGADISEAARRRAIEGQPTRRRTHVVAVHGGRAAAD
jgi:hypothetical protein